MANIFILTTPDTIAPVAADKDANRLIALAVERMTMAAAVGGAEVAEPAGEPVDVDAYAADLFGQVAAGALDGAEALAALKAMTAQAAAQAKAAKADPPVCLLAGEPATASEVKRAFRGAPSGTSVEVSSLDGSVTAGISMFRV